ncbi:MAG TPA: ATP-dependent DNA helicase RecQ [Polyangiaceae bacterium]|jgi:ATP-dependent DNA helicase RecQ|nr:ATP-dependent DNA helicase RecQ [Polyangiaceae bacterium]
MTHEELTRDIDELSGAWAAGDPGDATLRANCRERLERLRNVYRTQPDAFAADQVLMLKAVADGLRLPSPTGTGRLSAREALKATFGYDAFRPGQEAIIDAILAGRDCIGVMPTGAGKSLTYQLPARLLGGTALVISPLIALMKDQVDALHELGLRATFLNSTLDPAEKARRVEGLRNGEYELVYAAPEGLEASVGAVLRRVRLSLIAVDEAHCISQWGHDFRPAYRNLSNLRRRFGNVPILALTATATREVTQDIVAQLGMQTPASYRGSFFRKNLRVHAYRKGGDSGLNVRESIVRLIRARPNESGIVYCLSRKSVEGIAEFLTKNGISACAYHAGMSPEDRSSAQDAFRKDDVDVVVATVAFGMGIDKSNIRYVIHRDMPRSVEGYYQEIGRAGRDGVESDCVLFYSFADVMSYDRFSDDAADEAAERQRRQVREMFSLAERRECRHQSLVGYLGEEIGPCKTSCDFCLDKDVLSEAPKTVLKGRGRGRSTVSPPRRDAPTEETRIEPAHGELFERLRRLRKTIADSRNVPAYVVFSDATLLEIAAKKPQNASELLEISGVGPKKVATYGAEFLALLSSE